MNNLNNDVMYVLHALKWPDLMRKTTHAVDFNGVKIEIMIYFAV